MYSLFLVSLNLVQLSDQLAAALPDKEAHRPVEDLDQLLVVQVRPVVLADHTVPGTTQRHVQLGLDKPAIYFHQCSQLLVMSSKKMCTLFQTPLHWLGLG